MLPLELVELIVTNLEIWVLMQKETRSGGACHTSCICMTCRQGCMTGWHYLLIYENLDLIPAS